MSDALMTPQEHERRLNEEHVRKHNGQLQREIPGYVRVDGPRRQYVLSINDRGEIVQTEI